MLGSGTRLKGLALGYGQVVVPLQAFLPSWTAVPRTVPAVLPEMTLSRYAPTVPAKEIPYRVLARTVLPKTVEPLPTAIP